MSSVTANGSANGLQQDSTPSTLKVNAHQETSSDARNGHDYSLVKTLPCGIDELVKHYFATDVKGHYEAHSNLPVLKATTFAIMKQLQSSKQLQNTVQAEMLKANGGHERIRPHSLGEDIYGGELALVRSFWDVIFSFMSNADEALGKEQSTRLFETTVQERRKHFLSKSKLWRKVNSNETTLGSKTSSIRPTSMYVESEKDTVRNSHSKDTALSSENLAKMTVLDKVQYLANIGIKNEHFRDEIYCQILKQLNLNPSLRSTALGWILLALIIGCFPPTKKIFSAIHQYLEHQRSTCSIYCKDKLLRVLEKGERRMPPCSLELQAAKARQDIRLPVICMDHSVRTIRTDSSTTAEEICSIIASKNRLKDSFGFSIHLSLSNKLVNLGSGNLHIMDAISHAERFSKMNHIQEIWRIYYRRDFFSPLDAIGIQDNQMKARLTYAQICGGVQSGEYKCTKSQDLSLLIAHQYCVKNGLKKVDMKRVLAICDKNFPTSVYTENKKKHWCKMVYDTLKALQAKSNSKGEMDTLDIMQQVIRFASKAFVKSFTKSFILSSFHRTSDLGTTCIFNGILRLNHEKMIVSSNIVENRRDCVSNGLKECLEVDFGNVTNVKLLGSRELNSRQQVRVSILLDQILLLDSPQAAEIAETLLRLTDEFTLYSRTESTA